VFLPAAGQGTITVEVREADARTRERVAAIDHADTSIALSCERAFLAVLDGSCRTPIGGYATIDAGVIRFRGMILRADGSEAHETVRSGNVGTACALGADAGAEVKARAPADCFAAG